MLKPSTTGNQFTVFSAGRPPELGRASMISSEVLPRRHESTLAGSLQPAAAASASPCFSAVCSGLEMPVQAPLSMMTRWKRPSLFGETMCRQALMPPADSPNRVTRAGSPPNAPMFALTHASAAR